jgi:hypothetical protein
MKFLKYLAIALFLVAPSSFAFQDVIPTNVRIQYSSTAVTTSAYTVLVASLPYNISGMYIFDSSGQTLKIAVGASGSEKMYILVPPGGNGFVGNTLLSAGQRITIEAVSATANAGELDITFLH